MGLITSNASTASRLLRTRNIQGVGFNGTADITLPNVTSAAAGLAPASGGGTVNFLRADGSWATPPDTNTTYSTFTTGADGLVPKTTTSNTTDYLRRDGSWATPPNTTYSTFTTGADGLVPKTTTSNTTDYLRRDGSWATPPDTNTTYSTFTTANDGLVPKTTTSNTTDYLRRDGTWATPPDTNTWTANSSSAAGYVSSGSGQANKVWKTDASGNPAWRDDADTNTTYSVFNTTADGLVPKTTTSNTTDYLRRDGSWATPNYPVTSVAGKSGALILVASDVGLGNVDNTADSAKNVLSATKLTTARNINGVSFDGTQDISITADAGPHTHMANDLPAINDINRRTVTGTINTSGYYRFASTPINPREYSATFKITITSTDYPSTIGQTLYVQIKGYGNSTPQIFATSEVINSGSSYSGIYSIRKVYLKSIDNGYNACFDFYVGTSYLRYVKIEMLDSANVTLLSAFEASATYNSTYQNATTTYVYYNGVITNGSFYGGLIGSVTGNATTSDKAKGLLIQYNASAGEALSSTDIVYFSGTGYWMKVAVSGRSIPFGTMIAKCNASVSSGSYADMYTYGEMYVTATTGTKTLYKDVYIRGTISGNNLVTDGTITTELTADASYMRIGYVSYTNYIFFDGNNYVYTIKGGKLTAVNGFSINANTNAVNDTQPTGQVTGDVWIQTF